MKRSWQIFVLFLAISSLLAPVRLLCAQDRPLDHTCCAPEAQLAAPSCCQSGTTPQSAIPSNSGDQSTTKLATSLLPVNWMSIQQTVIAQYRPKALPPILLPATILRT
jgi:hypothetical protein